MRKTAFFGSVTNSGAYFSRSPFNADTSSSMGAFTCVSYCSLRGWNHSRRLFFYSARRKRIASGGKPGNRGAIIGKGDGSRLVQIPDLSISDRKSTRLNSSHLVISYAVFCLKKK